MAAKALRSQPEEATKKGARILGVHVHHLGGGRRGALDELGRCLAGSGKVVGLLELETGRLEMSVYSPRTSLADELETGEYAGDAAWPWFTPWMAKLDYLLLAWGPELGRYESRLQGLLDGTCVVASPERDALVASYQLLKRLSPRLKGRQAGVFVAHTTSEAEARAVCGKLAKTALDFAGLALDDYGYSRAGEAAVQRVSVWTGPAGGQEWLMNLECWLGERTDEPPEMGTAPMEDPAPPENSRDDDLVLIESESSGQITAEAVGSRLLPGTRAVGDSLAAFLRSVGLNCERFEFPDGRGAWVLVIQSQDSLADALWAAGHYPYPEDRLVLVTDQPMGKLERSVWARYFADVRIVPLLAGTRQGRPIWVVKK